MPSWKSGAIPLRPLYAFTAWTGVTLLYAVNFYASSMGTHWTIHKLQIFNEIQRKAVRIKAIFFCSFYLWISDLSILLPPSIFFLFFLFAFVRCVYRSVYVSVCLSRLFPASFPLHCAPWHLDYVTSADVTQLDCRNTWNCWPHNCFLTLFTFVVKMEAVCLPLTLQGRRGKRKEAYGWCGGMALLILKWYVMDANCSNLKIP